MISKSDMSNSDRTSYLRYDVEITYKMARAKTTKLLIVDVDLCAAETITETECNKTFFMMCAYYLKIIYLFFSCHLMKHKVLTLTYLFTDVTILEYITYTYLILNKVVSTNRTNIFTCQFVY